MEKVKCVNLYRFSYVLIFILYKMQVGCNYENCEILEKHSNGTAKLEMCVVNKQQGHYLYKAFYDDGKLETLFHLINGKLEGEVTEYFQNGSTKSKTIYKNGLKDGDYYEFYQNGKINLYNFFAADHVIYIKDYLYGLNDSIKIEEGFIPILDFNQNSDTIFCKKNTLNFKLSIPLPDSIFSEKDLIYKFGTKSLLFRDSILLDSLNEIVLDNKKTISCKLKLQPAATQIFYGYIFDKKANHIYQPFEKTVILLQ